MKLASTNFLTFFILLYIVRPTEYTSKDRSKVERILSPENNFRNKDVHCSCIVLGENGQFQCPSVGQELQSKVHSYPFIKKNCPVCLPVTMKGTGNIKRLGSNRRLIHIYLSNVYEGFK